MWHPVVVIWLIVVSLCLPSSSVPFKHLLSVTHVHASSSTTCMFPANELISSPLHLHSVCFHLPKTFAFFFSLFNQRIVHRLDLKKKTCEGRLFDIWVKGAEGEACTWQREIKQQNGVKVERDFFLFFLFPDRNTLVIIIIKDKQLVLFSHHSPGYQRWHPLQAIIT